MKIKVGVHRDGLHVLEPVAVFTTTGDRLNGILEKIIPPVTDAVHGLPPVEVELPDPDIPIYLAVASIQREVTSQVRDRRFYNEDRYWGWISARASLIRSAFPVKRCAECKEWFVKNDAPQWLKNVLPGNEIHWRLLAHFYPSDE